jgi:hypothetical protein
MVADFRRPTALSEVRYEIALRQLVLLALSELDAQPLHPLYNLSRERVEKAIAWYDENRSTYGDSSSLATPLVPGWNRLFEK